MPLRLIPPRPGKTPYWSIRGTHLGVHLDRSAKTGDRRLARKVLRKLEGEIESGVIVRSASFASAAIAYMQSGRERTFLPPLLRHFGETPIGRIDQEAVDQAAAQLYPRASAATRNRQVYTPVAAILNYVQPDRMVRFRRPKLGAQRTRWVEPEQFELLAANLPTKLRRLAIFLVYSGCRLGEALGLEWQTVSLAERVAYVPATKNGLPRAVHLTDRMLAELAEIEPKAGSVFGYKNRWSVAHGWRAGARRAGLPWVTPHVLRHTWATWMRRYSGADLNALIATGAWKDIKSALRYVHVVQTEEARRADLLPRPLENLGTKK